MASCVRNTRMLRSLNLICRQTSRNFSSTKHVTQHKIPWIIGAATGFAFLYSRYRYKRENVVASSSTGLPKHRHEEDNSTEFHLNRRMKRFTQYASVKYDGLLFMTPADFLRSVVDDVCSYTFLGSKVNAKSTRISQKEYEKHIASTPPKSKNSSRFFRDLGDSGLISYSEYLFLLCLLTKPETGYRVAFSMFDTDRNNRMSKDEFLVVYRLLSAHFAGKTCSNDIAYSLIEDPEFAPETTLTTHFFGSRGSGDLTYEEFVNFIDNLQKEVYHSVFLRYSRGMATIPESAFVRVVLAHTRVNTVDYETLVKKVQDTLDREEGIDFEEFLKFFRFLNNLDDFTIAIKLFTLAGRAISKEEFQRAVKACVGYALHDRIVDCLFVIFDENGDGFLSQHEFMCQMRESVALGLAKRHNESPSMWENFRHCVRDKYVARRT